jgi:hypothetical protein
MELGPLLVVDFALTLLACTVINFAAHRFFRRNLYSFLVTLVLGIPAVFIIVSIMEKAWTSNCTGIGCIGVAIAAGLIIVIFTLAVYLLSATGIALIRWWKGRKRKSTR